MILRSSPPEQKCLYSSIRDHEETLRASVAGLWLQIPNQRTEDFGGAWPTPILVAMAVPVSRVLPSVGHRSATLLLGEQGLQSKCETLHNQTDEGRHHVHMRTL